MYNYNHLYYFYVAAKHGGVTKAAKHLKISQPSLSSQLKVLESALDVKLFQKTGRSNDLTEAGSVIYGFCRQMFELSEQMSESIASRVSTAMRRIHIGVSDEVDRNFVIEVVSLFLKRHGEERPTVTVTSGSREKLFASLLFRELDVVISELAPTDRELNTLSHAEVPVALICPRLKKLQAVGSKTQASAAIRDMIQESDLQWVMPASRFKLRTEIDHFFETNKLKGRVVFESDMMGSLVRSVMDEIGFTFLPLLYVAKEVREHSVKIICPKNGFWKHRVWLISHNQNRNDSLLKTLGQSFDEICRQATH